MSLGYHSQTIPTYRAIFDLLGLIGVLGDVHEDEFLAEWLANEEVKQWKVRQAAKRESDHLREQLQSDGYTEQGGDAAQLMNNLYRPLSDGSHGRREAVRTYISETLRQAATGVHPSALERLVTTEGSLLLLEDLVQVVGGCARLPLRRDVLRRPSSAPARGGRVSDGKVADHPSDTRTRK